MEGDKISRPRRHSKRERNSNITLKIIIKSQGKKGKEDKNKKEL